MPALVHGANAYSVLTADGRSRYALLHPSVSASLDCLCLVEQLYQRLRFERGAYPIELLRLDLRLTHSVLFSPHCPLLDRPFFLERLRSLQRDLGNSHGG